MAQKYTDHATVSNWLQQSTNILAAIVAMPLFQDNCESVQ